MHGTPWLRALYRAREFVGFRALWPLHPPSDPASDVQAWIRANLPPPPRPLQRTEPSNPIPKLEIKMRVYENGGRIPYSKDPNKVSPFFRKPPNGPKARRTWEPMNSSHRNDHIQAAVGIEGRPLWGWGGGLGFRV